MLWLQKDLRQSNSRIETQFLQLLQEISPSNSSSSVILHIDCGSLDGSVAAFANNTNSTTGFSHDEILQIAYYAGVHPTVRLYFMFTILFSFFFTDGFFVGRFL